MPEVSVPSQDKSAGITAQVYDLTVFPAESIITAFQASSTEK